MRQYQIIIRYENNNEIIVKSRLINESEVYNEFYSFIHELEATIGKGLNVQEIYYKEEGYIFICPFIYNGVPYRINCDFVIGLDTNMIVKSFMNHIRFDEFMEEQRKKLL